MAGSPERQISQPPIEARERIDAFNHSLIIKEHIPRRDNNWADFQRLDNELVSKTKIKIPSLLCNQLGLTSLNWQGLGSCLSVLYTGTTPEGYENNYGSTDIKFATATIEIAHRIDLSSGREKEIPMFFRIVGVNKEQNRIVIATYNLENQKRLIRLSVSLSDEEIDRKPSGYSRIMTLLPQSIISLTRSEDGIYPCSAADLVTAEMRKTTNVKYPEDLLFAFDFHMVADANWPEHLKPEVNFSHLIRSGYYVKQEREVIIVGRRDVKPWEISMPESLQEANTRSYLP